MTDRPTADKSLGELVSQATRDLSALVRQEVALAKAEIGQEVANAGKGAGMLGGAGGAALFAVVFLSIALAYGISALGIPLGAGFLVVGLLYLLVAALLALLGRKSLKKVKAPERTITSVKEDLAWAKHPTQVPGSGAARHAAR